MLSSFDALEPLPQDWFFELTGFEEPRGPGAGDIIRKTLQYDDTLGTITSIKTNRVMGCGKLSTPSWKELAGEVHERDLFLTRSASNMKLSAVKDDIQQIHLRPENAGSVIQVASQFNLLEMTSPLIKPSDGITRYQTDLTQGPACAIACGAGTIYRNYYAQDDDHQIECLKPFIDGLGLHIPLCETMNGYVLLNGTGVRVIDDYLATHYPMDLDLIHRILVGIQENTEVTINGAGHRVTQVYCSAISLSYQDMDIQEACVPFANKILENAYQSTLLAAMLQQANGSGNNKVFLTLLGAGAFGNKRSNVIESIKQALLIFKRWCELDVIIVCYSDDELADVQRLVSDFYNF